LTSQRILEALASKDTEVQALEQKLELQLKQALQSEQDVSLYFFSSSTLLFSYCPDADFSAAVHHFDAN
jgi:hypothetical protein